MILKSWFLVLGSWFLVLGLLLSENAYAATIGELEKLRKEKLETAANGSQKLTSEKITNDWLKNKTVNDLRKLNFYFHKSRVTITQNSVQYHLYKTFNDPIVTVYIICFLDSEKTTCRLI